MINCQRGAPCHIICDYGNCDGLTINVNDASDFICTGNGDGASCPPSAPPPYSSSTAEPTSIPTPNPTPIPTPMPTDDDQMSIPPIPPIPGITDTIIESASPLPPTTSSEPTPIPSPPLPLEEYDPTPSPTPHPTIDLDLIEAEPISEPNSPPNPTRILQVFLYRFYTYILYKKYSE